MRKISVIIKSLNEEENIARAIESALKAVKEYDSEVIVSDSLSTDRTIEIAKRYPIRIIQNKNPKDKSCGMGAQLGYLFSKGKYIYILDADMELNENFIKKGIKELEKNKTLAGVGGLIKEMTDNNVIFNRRKKAEASKVEKVRFVDKLMMGGLYKKEAIEKAGYFANPYLHAYEESDLGHRLTSLGYKFKRLPIPMIKHYGDKITSLQIFKNRWESRYLWGCGEFLRYNLGKPTFLKVVKELKLYLIVILWWATLLISLILTFITLFYIYTQAILTIIFILLFIIKKRSIKESLFSFFSWNITALGLIFGFFQKPKNIHKKIDTKIIK